MCSVCSAKCHLGVLVDGVINPLVDSSGRELNVSNVGHYMRGVWQEQTCHGNILPGFRRQGEARWVKLLTRLPRKMLPFHFESWKS